MDDKGMQEPGRRKDIAPHPRNIGGGMSKVEKYKWTMEDEPGVPFLLHKDELKVDDDYQRTISETRVTAISQHWSWLACGSLFVAEREPGAFFVFDGGNRLEAARRRSDVAELPCVVFKLNNKMAEAMAFWRCNCNRGAVTSYHKMRALLVSGDQVSRDVLALLVEQGFKPVAAGNHGPNTVGCLAGFTSAFRSNRELLSVMWPIIAELHRGLPLNDRAFKAIMFAAQWGTADLSGPMWRKRIIAIGFADMKQSIDRAAALYATGGPRIWALGLIERLNKGLRSTQRIKLREDEE